MTPAPYRLGPLESKVMDVLWDSGPSSIRDIIGRVGGSPAYTTIATVLGNLEKKDLVSSRRDGRKVLFRARAAREHHVVTMMRHALDSTPNREASIHHFVDSMPARDRELLRDYLSRTAEQDRP